MSLVESRVTTVDDVNLPACGRNRRSPLEIWPPLLLVALGIVFFADPLFSSKNYYFRDILNFHYPLRKLLVASYAAGEFPLWNPYVYLGQPMLANPNYMAFYPTNLFHLFLPFNYAFKLHFIVHPVLGGLGIYFFQRRLGIGAIAALGGSLAYEFSGTVLSFLNLYNIVPAVALMPWIGWAFWGALKEKRLRRILILGMFLALQLIAFEPLMFQCDVWLLAGLAVLHMLDSCNKRVALQRILLVGLAGAFVALGLAAIQLLPSLELLPRSARGAGIDYSVVSRWSMHPMDFLNVIVPNLFGECFSIGYATSWGEFLHHGDIGVLVSYFLGCSTVLLALVSFAGTQRRIRQAMTGVAALSIFLALGRFNPLYRLLFEHIPFLGLGRYPSKYFLLATLALCILSSLGFEVILLARNNGIVRSGYLRTVCTVALVLGLFVIGAWMWCRSHPLALERIVRAELEPEQARLKDFPFIVSQLSQSIRSTGVFLLLSAGLILGARFWKPPIIGGLVLILWCAELLPANLRLSPLISDADVDFSPEIERYITRHGPNEPFRVVAPNWLPPRFNRLRAPNRSLAWTSVFYRMTSQTMGGIPRGIEYSIDGTVDMLNTLESEEMYKSCVLLPEPQRLRFIEKLNSPMLLALGEVMDPALRPLASFETLSDYRLNVYWLENALPRAYFVHGVARVATHQGALDLLLRQDSPLRDSVILEGEGSSLAGSGSLEAAKVVTYQSNRVICDVSAGADGYLILLDSYYPGWQGYVDGRKTEIFRANYAFRAIAMGAGRHRVEFRYHPTSFYAGLAITSVSMLSCFVVLIGNFAADRRRANRE